MISSAFDMTKADALAKAGRYSIYQMSEEGCDYIKHISITLIGDKEGEDD